MFILWKRISSVKGRLSVNIPSIPITTPRSFTHTSHVLAANIQLRDYQLEAINSIKQAIGRGIRRPAFVLATGGGKTVVFSHLIPQITKSDPNRGDKVLVLAHTEELIKQAATTIKNINPLLKVDIDMRHMKPSYDDSDVIVGSVPTLIRLSRLEKYNPNDFKAIILDECHHATASSWTKILKYFDADTPDLDIYVIGCTATMERSDGKSLGEIFDEIVFERNLLTMIENKELVDVKFSSLKVDVDLTKVAVKNHDYEPSSLSDVINNSEINLLVAMSYKSLRQQYGFRSTLMFCVDINHCKTLCGVLQRTGINAQYVTGDTVKHERRAIIEDFKNGLIDVLCNVQVFTEGTDMPNIDSLFLVRPTKSRPLLVQMIGRGLRLYKGKHHCHVVDLAGTRGTGVQSVPTLFSLPSDYVIHGKTFKELEKETDTYLQQQEEFKAQELLEKERERQLEEQATYNKMVQLSKLEHKLKFDFITIDGFLALESRDMNQFTESKTIHSTLSKSSLDWLRLEYDVWAYVIDDKFFLLKRFDHQDKVLFKLSITGFTSLKHKVASNYKCGKFTTETTIMESYNLQTVVAKAEVLSNELGSSFPYKTYHQDKPLTNKQQQFLNSKLLIRAKENYELTDELINKLKQAIGNLTRKKASNLIFALRYSPKSFHSKWELQKMLGPDKKTNRAIKKLVSRPLNIADDWEDITPLTLLQ